MPVTTEAAWSIVTAVNDYTVGYVIRMSAQRRAVPADLRAAGNWTSVVNAYLTERATRPGDALFCGPTGDRLSRDALEHRLAIHLTTAAASCPSIADKPRRIWQSLKSH